MFRDRRSWLHEHGRFDPVTTGVVGDAELTLAGLLDGLGQPHTEDQRADVAARWAIWRAEKARRAADDRGRGVPAAAVFDALSRHLPADAVVATLSLSGSQQLDHLVMTTPLMT